MRSRAKWLTGMLTTVPGRTDGTMTTFGMGVYSSPYDERGRPGLRGAPGGRAGSRRGLGRWRDSACTGGENSDEKQRGASAGHSGGMLRTVWKWLVATTLVLAACSAAHPSAAQRVTQQHYIDNVHLNASDIGQYLSDGKVVKLGNVVCDGFRARASTQQIADRMELSGGHNLPPQDLGAIISAAVKQLCPAYAAQLNPVSQ